jgi:hypothetical protein
VLPEYHAVKPHRRGETDEENGGRSQQWSEPGRDHAAENRDQPAAHNRQDVETDRSEGVKQRGRQQRERDGGVEIQVQAAVGPRSRLGKHVEAGEKLVAWQQSLSGEGNPVRDAEGKPVRDPILPGKAARLELEQLGAFVWHPEYVFRQDRE